MTNTPKKTIIIHSSPVQPAKNSFETGLLLNFNSEKKGGFSIELLMVLDKKEGRSFQRIPLSGGRHLPYLPGLSPGVAGILKKLTDEALVDHLVKSGFAWLRDADKPFDHLDSRHFALLGDLIAGILQELKPLAPAVKHLFHLPQGLPFINQHIRPASISAFAPSLSFVLERGNGYLYLRCLVILNNGSFPLEDFEQVFFFLKSRNEYFLLKKEDKELLEKWKQETAVLGEEPLGEGMPEGEVRADEMPDGSMAEGVLRADEMLRGPVAPEGELAHFMESVVRPLTERYPVDTGSVIRRETLDASPEGRVYLSELNENFLLIKPKWLYGDMEVDEWEEQEMTVDRGN